MAHETQYCNLRYIFGTAYSGKTDASEISPDSQSKVSEISLIPLARSAQASTLGEDVRIAALSTIFRIVNLLMALSFGVHLEQFEHLIGFTCPLPFLFRPLRGVVSAAYDLLQVWDMTHTSTLAF